MATAEWGALEWGAGEWGSIDVGPADPVAIGSLALNGSAVLSGFPTGTATGSLALNGTAVGTSQILGVAVGVLELDGSAAGLAARRAQTLSECGHPMAADCESWLLRIFQRKA